MPDAVKVRPTNSLYGANVNARCAYAQYAPTNWATNETCLPIWRKVRVDLLEERYNSTFHILHSVIKVMVA